MVGVGGYLAGVRGCIHRYGISVSSVVSLQALYPPLTPATYRYQCLGVLPRYCRYLGHNTSLTGEYHGVTSRARSGGYLLGYPREGIAASRCTPLYSRISLIYTLRIEASLLKEYPKRCYD